MTPSGLAGTSRLEEFAAFNDEVAGLIRAGLPLEVGLGSDGRRRLADRVSERMRQGRSLDEALKEEGDAVPPAYRALVTAGIRSGRLAEAVETASRTARSLLSVRRRLSVAAVYPGMIVVTAYVLGVLILPRMMRSIVGITSQAGERPAPLAAWVLRVFDENPAYWQIWLPAVGLLVIWGAGRLMASALPMRSSRLSAFADLGAGLLDHGVPLDEALSLAAEASGDRGLAADAGAAAARLRQGESAASALAAFRSVPGFAHWMMKAGAATGTLPATLRQVADWAGRRAERRADWFVLLAPLAVTLFLGGSTVALFAAVAFGPTINLLHRLAREISA